MKYDYLKQLDFVLRVTVPLVSCRDTAELWLKN